MEPILATIAQLEGHSVDQYPPTMICGALTVVETGQI
jgi:hypothetical protein